MANSYLEKITRPAQFSTDLSVITLANLDHLSCYEVSGEDATTFLQGQFSNDITNVTSSDAQLTSYCTPKGRMLATLQICQFHSNYFLILSADIAEEVIKRLQMFVMRSKVDISLADKYSITGICHDPSAVVLNSINLDTPADEYKCTTNESAICINIPGIQPRYMLIANKDAESKVTELDSETIQVFSHDYWKWLDILSGTPTINKSTQEAFVPQMANLELIDGVSFSKGCYPGQEIVARLHYIGNANRRMFRVHCQDAGNIKDGDDIYTKEGSQSIGKVLSVIHHEDQTADALAVIRLEAVKQNQLVIGSSSGSPLEIKGLPYEVPLEEKEADN